MYSNNRPRNNNETHWDGIYVDAKFDIRTMRHRDGMERNGQNLNRWKEN
jgi:hypothetical protein